MLALVEEAEPLQPVVQLSLSLLVDIDGLKATRSNVAGQSLHFVQMQEMFHRVAGQLQLLERVANLLAAFQLIVAILVLGHLRLVAAGDVHHAWRAREASARGGRRRREQQGTR